MRDQVSIDAWVAANLPSGFTTDLRAMEMDHVAVVSAEYGRMFAQLDVELTALAQLIDVVNFVDRTDWPPHRTVQYLLIWANAKSFHSAIELLLKGHYEDCLAITRGLYETFVRTVFISCYPDAVASTLMPSPPKGERRFNLTNFLEHDLGLEWEANYKVMSTFAHSQAIVVLGAWQRALAREGEPERFGISHGFETERFELAAAFLQFVLLAHLRCVTDRLVGSSAVPDYDVLATALEARDLLQFCLEDHPKPYWQRIRGDLDYVFEVMEMADTGGDWKGFSRPADAASG